MTAFEDQPGGDGRSNPPARSSWGIDAAVIGLVVALLLGFGAAFASSWRDTSPGAGTDLAAFGSTPDGHSWLQVVHGGDGEAIRWEAGNTVSQPGLVAITSWREAPSTVVRELVADQGAVTTAQETRALRRLQAQEARIRTVDAEGTVSDSTTYSVLTSDGLYLVGYRDASGTEAMFDPPVLLLQPDVEAGASWETTGKLQATVDYAWRRSVVERGPFESALGQHDDCLLVEDSYQLSDPSGVLLDLVSRDRVCANVGIVETSVVESTTGAAGEVTTVVASASEESRIEDAPPAPEPRQPGSSTGIAPADDWAFSRLGNIASAAEATVPPLYLDGPEPLVLVAELDHGIVALHADEPGRDPAWRFTTGGAIHSPLRFDADRGLLFFGSTDGRLYALDARGMFRWAHQAGDNVATRPLVIDDVVVFGSEDRRVRGVDAVTGQLAWEVATGGPVVSSPAEAAGLVVIGSDDGALRGIDPANGDVAWETTLGDPIVGAVATDGTTAWVGTSGGQLAAIEGATGDLAWEAHVEWPVRTQPMPVGDALAIVDDGGIVTLLDRTTGDKRWSVDIEAVGVPVALADDELAVATSEGTVQVLDVTDGTAKHSWSAEDARGANDSEPVFELGPAAGGGALWLVDESTVLRRLGPAGEGATPDLAPAWIAQPNESPWTVGDVPASTPLEHDGRAIIIEYSGKIFSLDPADGSANLLGAVDLGDGAPFAGGTIAGDRLLFNAQHRLYAVDLPDVTVAWTFEGLPIGARPPVVVGDTVLWVSGPPLPDEQTVLPPTLFALDVATGQLRWQVELTGLPPLAGVVARDGVVYSATGAYDLATGEQLWANPTGLGGSGSPALSPDGSTLFVDASGDTSNGLTALDTSDGTVRWTVDGGQEFMTGLEGLWATDEVLVMASASNRVIGRATSTGAELWQYQARQPLLGTILVTGDAVWLATDTGAVHVLDAATGQPRASFTELDFPLHHYAYGQRPGLVGDHVVVAGGFYIMGFSTGSGQ